MTVSREQILPVILSIVVIVPAVFLGGLVSNLVSKVFYVGFWGSVAIGVAPAMLAAAMISYKWPDKFWRIAPVMTATLFALLIAEGWGKRKGPLWGLGLLYVSLPLVPCFFASILGYWLRMRADSRSET
jgi:hypothetical protein